MVIAGLYATARYGLYFEQYIDGYIINDVITLDALYKTGAGLGVHVRGREDVG